jgi:hypothetical protein
MVAPYRHFGIGQLLVNAGTQEVGYSGILEFDSIFSLVDIFVSGISKDDLRPDWLHAIGLSS